MAELLIDALCVSAVVGGCCLGGICGMLLGGMPGCLLMGLAGFGLACWWADEVLEMYDGFTRRW